MGETHLCNISNQDPHPCISNSQHTTTQNLATCSRSSKITTNPPTSTPDHPVRMMRMPLLPMTTLSEAQEVYWLKCLPTGPATPHIQFKFNQLKAQIYTLHPYKTPQAEIHCTLNATETDDCLYTADWDEDMMHLTPPIRCCTIVCGPEGVAAPVILRSRNLHAPLAWTAEASTAIAFLKTDLSAAAALTAPDYKNKFHLDVSEREGFTSSVLFQKQEGERRVLMYYSSNLTTLR